jgi:hypothetical protein
MEGRGKPNADKYKEITNDLLAYSWLHKTSLPVWDFENFKCLIFVGQTVHSSCKINLETRPRKEYK